jgi:hypothetical protein
VLRKFAGLRLTAFFCRLQPLAATMPQGPVVHDVKMQEL